MDKKEAAYLSDVLKAYSEGKSIQARNLNPASDYSDWKDIEYISLYDTTMEYRIKPEPIYRPYTNSEEFLKDEKKHGPRIVTSQGLRRIDIINGDSFLWNTPLKNKEPIYESLSELIKFKWQDGTPCGILIE